MPFDLKMKGPALMESPLGNRKLVNRIEFRELQGDLHMDLGLG